MKQNDLKLTFAHYAGGIIRKDENILLISQSDSNDPFAGCALPQGRVEADELLEEGMIREVEEETGLEVLEVGSLVYAAQGTYSLPEGTKQSTAFIYEVQNWRGELQPNDPEIVDARFFPIAEAIEKLRELPTTRMREPILAYLQDEVGVGAVWYYLGQSDGSETLVGRQPSLPKSAEL